MSARVSSASSASSAPSARRPAFLRPAPEKPAPVHIVEPTAYAAGLLATQPCRGYDLASCLAATDVSAIFKAHDRNMDRPVAVKIMRAHPGRTGAVEDYFSLAGSIARLRVAGAARGLDAGRGGADFFLAYEFLAGTSLAGRLARRQSGKYTEAETLRIIGGVARVLQELFDAGHTHGHLHPGNIMLADGGSPRLADIGFAWNLAWPDDESAFQSKPDYLPPERIAGEFNIDIRGDLYSLGAIWHWLLIGRPVFGGRDPAETLDMHREAEPIPVRELDPRLSAATSQLVAWLLEKDRDRRPRTPKEFLRKLAAHPILADEREKAGAAAADGPDNAANATEPERGDE